MSKQRVEKETIGQAIVRLAAEWVAERCYKCPCAINTGLCFDFAAAISKQFDGARPIWGYEVKPDLRRGDDHCVIRYEGRYYDSQCPEGVDRIEDIPFWKTTRWCTCKAV